MIDHVVINATAGREDAVNIAIAREILAQPRQSFVAPAEIETLGRTGRKRAGLHPHIVAQPGFS
jgi:hypothetical protein